MRDAMARDAARWGDPHICPKVTAGRPHVKGPIVDGETTVFICGEPAARIYDPAACEQASLFGDFIFEGRDDVLIGGRAAARRYDRTFHGGMIMSGCFRVQIGPGDFDAVAVAIARIEASAYGRTPKGRAQVERLKKLHAEGKITVEGYDPHKKGDTHPKTDEIRVFTTEDDIEGIASVLVHEERHVEHNDKRRAGESVDTRAEEKDAWDAQNEFYKEQKEQTGYWDESNDAYDEADDKEKLLEDNHDEDYWDQER